MIKSAQAPLWGVYYFLTVARVSFWFVRFSFWSYYQPSDSDSFLLSSCVLICDQPSLSRTTLFSGWAATLAFRATESPHCSYTAYRCAQETRVIRKASMFRYKYRTVSQSRSAIKVEPERVACSNYVVHCCCRQAQTAADV